MRPLHNALFSYPLENKLILLILPCFAILHILFFLQKETG